MSVKSSNKARLISKLSLASSIFSANLDKNSPLVSEFAAIFGRLIVTTPTEPVRGFEPNNPPPLYSSSLLSILNLQHIERASSGDMSELMKFEKYGMPYFAAISHKPSIFLLSQSKSFVMLYVGIGNVNTLPELSPFIITSKNALFSMSISFWKSL